MKLLSVIFMAIIFLANPSAIFAQDSLQIGQEEILEKIDQLDLRIKEIRRDQINYRIEKDLLKEMYTSNLKSINLIITIILAVIGGISYLGMRNIGKLKDDYSKELESFKSISNEFKQRAKEIENKQEEVSGKFTEIIKENAEQDKKIKLLEILEKISTLISHKSFNRAYDYISIGLDMDPENLDLLHYKSICDIKKRNFNEAIKTYRKILSIDPDDNISITNTTEFLLIEERVDEYEDFYKEYKDIIDDRRNGFLINYLNILEQYVRGDVQELRTKIQEFISNFEYLKENSEGWDFSEVKHYLSKKEKNEIKELFLDFIKVIEGDLDLSTYKEKHFS